MAEINWTREAEKWLLDIYEYIADDNPFAASKVISGIYAKAQKLKEFPKIGYIYRQEDGVRIILYGHYRITYIVKSQNEIDIIGVFHGALDMERYLK